MRTWILVGLFLVLAQPVCSAEEVAFQRHLINPRSEFSACAALDVNQDGRLDIVSGGYWYEAPNWELRRLRDVQLIRGRYDDYSNLPLDVNGDGHTDLISANYRSRSVYWVQNPGDPQRTWTKHPIDEPGSSETGRLADMDGDGDLDLLPNGTKFAAWYEIDRAQSTPEKVAWIKHDLPPEVIGHGLGVGDINGDGRADLVAPRGWLEAPQDRAAERWQWRPEFHLHRDCSIPILVHDVDGDGDNDLIWGRGHNIGLYWLEQSTHDDGSRRWQFHAIDTSWSACHALLLADINGDGKTDLVAGKRYLGHDGKDPGEYDPLAIYWYAFDPATRSWRRHTVSEGHDCGFDLDPKCVDIDADGDVDIVAAARSGLFLLENLGKRPATAAAAPAAPPTGLLQYRDPNGRLAAVSDPFQWGMRRADILRQMQRVMGPLPSSHDRLPLRMQVVSQQRLPSYTKQTIRYRADDLDRVPAYLLLPHDLTEAAPAMLCLHSTRASGKASVCGEVPGLAYAHELAQLGFICLVPDYPSLGEYDYDFDRHAQRYPSGSMKAIWNNIRGIDLLESLPQVHPDRIGAIGHSLGGHNALFTAAFDQRIRWVVTSCGFNAFEDYDGGDLTGWSGPRYMPRIDQLYQRDPARMPFDFDEVLAALAPRPVFVSAPLGDDNFPVVGVRKAVAEAMRVYQFRQAEDALRVTYPDTDHRFPDAVRAEAYRWIQQQLR